MSQDVKERERQGDAGRSNRDGEGEERACRRTRERNSTEACLPRRTRCKGARTRRCHAFSTGRRGLQLHDVDVDSHDGDEDDDCDDDDRDEDEDEDEKDDEVDVITGAPRLTTVDQEFSIFHPWNV